MSKVKWMYKLNMICNNLLKNSTDDMNQIIYGVKIKIYNSIPSPRNPQNQFRVKYKSNNGNFHNKKVIHNDIIILGNIKDNYENFEIR